MGQTALRVKIVGKQRPRNGLWEARDWCVQPCLWVRGERVGPGVGRGVRSKCYWDGAGVGFWGTFASKDVGVGWRGSCERVA